MLKAISMIQAAKKEKAISTPVIVDLHPSRPDYRGVQVLGEPISLEADPTFVEIEKAGATISKHAEAHTVLDGFFLISGEIPRVTPYEIGIKNGIRFDSTSELWSPDPDIKDERFLMVNLKGLEFSKQYSEY